MDGVLEKKKDTSVIDDYANQLYEVSEIILFTLGKELLKSLLNMLFTTVCRLCT